MLKFKKVLGQALFGPAGAYASLQIHQMRLSAMDGWERLTGVKVLHVVFCACCILYTC